MYEQFSLGDEDAHPYASGSEAYVSEASLRRQHVPDGYAGEYEYCQAQGVPYFGDYGNLPARAAASPPPVGDSSQPLPGESIPCEPNPGKPLRLMYAGPCFSSGGVEQHALSLAKFLNPRRVKFTKYLVTHSDGIQRPSVADLPFPVQPCRTEAFSQAVRDADVLLMWGEGFDSRLAGVRPLCVYVAHGESWWTRKGLVSSRQVTDHVIAVSKRVEHQVCNGFPTTTIANGVDAGRLGQTRSSESVREQCGFSPDDFVLGSVGRFAREKHMDLLIDAVALLPRRFKLLLVGHGPRRADLLDLANERIPGRYAFVRAEDYLGDYYRAMDAFCLASAHEGFGLVIPEAMLCERPVIVTNVGCVPEVLRHRVSGLAVEHTAQAFAEAAALVQAHPAWARGMALEGRVFADRHLHASRMARDYENLLLRLHRTRSGSRREAAT